MSKKRNKSREEQQDIENYYDLKTDAVDRLVNASDSDATEVGTDAPDPYKMGFLSRVPNWLKAIFIKFWFNGAVCFFFIWGLSAYIDGTWTLVLITGLAMGIVTDILVNNIFRFTQSDERENDKWMMIPQKGFWTFFVNILYALFVVVLIVLIYNGVNLLLIHAQNLSETDVPFSVEPFSFGLIYLLVDLAFIWIKNLFVYLARRSKERKVASEPIGDIVAADAESADNLDGAETAAEELSAQKESPNAPVIIRQPLHSGKKHKKK